MNKLQKQGHRSKQRPAQFGRGAQQPDAGNAAFTLIECLAVVAALALLACVALPALAATRSDHQRILCMNNLRQIGQAFSGWKNEHGDRTPPWVPFAEGGTMWHSLRQNLWVHYSCLSNHLSTPKLVGCPSDAFVKLALTWSNKPDQGFVGPSGLGDRAVSYALGLHALPDYPTEVLGSDHYWAPVLSDTACETGVQAKTLPTYNPNLGWRNDGDHEGLGNMLLNDGHVRTTDSDGLRAYIQRTGKYHEAHEHVLPPNRDTR